MSEYVDLGSPELNALRDARREAGEAEGVTETERWFMLDQAVRQFIVATRKATEPEPPIDKTGYPKRCAICNRWKVAGVCQGPHEGVAG